MRSSTRGSTGSSLRWIEKPKSPVAAARSQARYCTGRGWSSPRRARSAAISAWDIGDVRIDVGVDRIAGRQPQQHEDKHAQGEQHQQSDSEASQDDMAA